MTLEISTYREYFLFDYRQSSYALRYWRDRWELVARRNNYGGIDHIPSFRYFDTLEEIEEEIKGLAGLTETILELEGRA